MVLEAVTCPHCQGDDVVKHGRTAEGKQRYKCRHTECPRTTFIRTYSYRGYLPEVKQQIGDMAMNGSGIRDTARVLQISPTTVIEELKKKAPKLEQVNRSRLAHRPSPTAPVMVVRVEAAECDEMWSFVGSKAQQRWLWHAIDHASGAVLAYVLAPHEDAALLELKQLLAPFGIQRFYTDNWGAYQRHLERDQHVVGKTNTQKIERKHLTLRTRIKRLARKTICFSKSVVMHDTVIGLFINRFEFGNAV